MTGIAMGRLISTKPGKLIDIRDQEFKSYSDSVTSVLEV